MAWLKLQHLLQLALDPKVLRLSLPLKTFILIPITWTPNPSWDLPNTIPVVDLDGLAVLQGDLASFWCHFHSVSQVCHLAHTG